MNILNTLATWQWATLAAVPAAIILLYFLKLKRQPQRVPSTYLWSRTIEDLHVNSIWQRLRRNLLLFLQLLLILLIVLSLLRPGWRGVELMGNRFVFLIDHSASMDATDQSPNRLEKAKQSALQCVRRMKTGDVAMVISFSDTAQIVQTFTQQRRLLRQRINDIRPTNRTTDLHEALKAAAGLANPNYTRLQDNQAVDEALPATLYLFSDGGFAPVRDFSLGNLQPVFKPIGVTGTGNVGIVAFSTDRNPEKPDQLQAFARVRNFATSEATVTIELFLDDTSLDLVELDIPAGESRGWEFDLPDVDAGELMLVLAPDDALAADNKVYAVVNRPQPAKVLLVTPGNDALRVALSTPQAAEIADVTFADPSGLADKTYQTEAEAGAYDLIIYDRCSPPSLPQSNTLFIGSLPPNGAWKSRKHEGVPQIVDVDRTHPLTQFVEMSHIKIAGGFELIPPPGSHVLFHAVIGPILAIAPRDGFEDVVLGFTLLDTVDGQVVPNTTWPLRQSFPVFIYNTLRYLGGSHGALSASTVRPGKAITLRTPAYVDEVAVVLPDGRRRPMQRQSPTAFTFAETDQLGIYKVIESGQNQESLRFAVNLFRERESDLEPRMSIELGHTKVVGQVSMQPTRRELWKWLVAAGLLLLLFEWYIYNRRVYL